MLQVDKHYFRPWGRVVDMKNLKKSQINGKAQFLGEKIRDFVNYTYARWWEPVACQHPLFVYLITGQIII